MNENDKLRAALNRYLDAGVNLNKLTRQHDDAQKELVEAEQHLTRTLKAIGRTAVVLGDKRYSPTGQNGEIIEEPFADVVL